MTIEAEGRFSRKFIVDNIIFELFASGILRAERAWWLTRAATFLPVISKRLPIGGMRPHR
ncbi:hypothetical protein CHELA40_12730 [Chelatococcus asaccharovorans]|nr:hypothetical protein CHELA40_12730 [Chelatococcus asaccharovorans]